MPALKILSKILKALSSDASPVQLAWGFVLGMFFGVIPFWSLYSIIILVLIIVLRVNLSMAIAGWLIFELIAFFLDPLFHSVGYALLTQVDFLQPLWVFLSQSPVLSWLSFNNTVMLGGFVISLVLLLPVFVAGRIFVVYYREKLHPRVQRLKIVQVFKGTKFYSIIQRALKLGE